MTLFKLITSCLKIIFYLKLSNYYPPISAELNLNATLLTFLVFTTHHYYWAQLLNGTVLYVEKVYVLVSAVSFHIEVNFELIALMDTEYRLL